MWGWTQGEGAGVWTWQVAGLGTRSGDGMEPRAAESAGEKTILVSLIAVYFLWKAWG